MNKQVFTQDFLECVLSDWNYKQIIINGETVYDVNHDVSIGLNEFYEKCKKLQPLVTLYWTDIKITPYENFKADGVCISFTIGADIW